MHAPNNNNKSNSSYVQTDLAINLFLIERIWMAYDDWLKKNEKKLVVTSI